MKKITVLGLDLGVSSLGWALLEKNEHDEFCGIVAAGARIFEPGIEIDDYTGKAVSRAAERRGKRQLRRQTKRRRRRLARVRHLLQGGGMLPPEENFGENIRSFDMSLLDDFRREQPAELPNILDLPQLLPYYLRARALDRPLNKMEMGRALYHLAQRRGFLSNRKSSKSDEDAGVVKTEISEIRQKMAEYGARTLGEYFSRLSAAKDKIRRCYTARDMYEDEFDQICRNQPHLIDEELKQKLFKAIFFQRPLRSVKHLVGPCILEPTQRRCKWNNQDAQKFRILQDINNLVIIMPDHNQRILNREEREMLRSILDCRDIGKLDKNGRLSFAAARKLLSLPKGAVFSLENSGEKGLKADPIEFKLGNIMGEKWKFGSPEFRRNTITELRSFTSPEGLFKRLRDDYGIEEETARRLSEYTLPEGYCNLSLRAIKRLLPELEAGLTYGEAVKKLYPETFKPSAASIALLPPIEELKDIRNPGVTKTLSETRRVVNAIIKKFGKPDFIRIELARDLKNPEKRRREIRDRNREQEKIRDRIREEIQSFGIANPTQDDILKVMLMKECRGICPYTGRSISMHSLLVESQFDIEHIIPYSRSMDNSYLNKTLCYHDENRHVKKNDTPAEAYAGDPEKYERILAEVKKFTGPKEIVAEKLRRFQIRDCSELGDFCSRQLNDTRYASKLAKEYLGSLYGGVVDADGVLKVQAGSGGVSALLRNILNLNRLLGDGGKNRGDHRHHAVDAVVIALSEPHLINRISSFFADKDAGFKAARFYDNLREALRLPDWSGYWHDIGDVLAGMLISHHIRRRVRGALHEDTFYGKPAADSPSERTITKPLDALGPKDVACIVDHAVRKAVIAKLAELNTNEPVKVFKNHQNLPVIRGKNNTVIPIKRVKIRRNQETVRIGSGDAGREVKLGNNHHMELYSVLDANGNELRVEGYVVSIFEARERLRQGLPIFIRKQPPIQEKGQLLWQSYKFSLFNGDVIHTREEKDDSSAYRIIRSIPQSKQITYVNLNDARLLKDIKSAGDMYSAMPNTLCNKMTGKFIVNELGELRRDHA
jgi:CRISPR-associated endonuclease Csn1